MYDVIVIGAGLAGALTALELSNKYRILLVEAGTEVIPAISSSYNECYKLHTGMHYIGDEKTAEQCLLKAIEFARNFPDFIADGPNLFSHCRRGRHYIMENSMISIDEAKAIALHLKQLYSDLIKQDPKNKVFGEPAHFMKFLEKEDYNFLANSIPYYDKSGEESQTSVVFGIETAESQIDIDALKMYLQTEIEKNPNITFMPSTKARNIAYCETELGYRVTVQRNGKFESLSATTLVNCAWQNIEKLDKTLGAYTLDENRVIRIKASILVKLPKPLRKLNTCIFSSGPYCSITVLPNGCAILTSERISNVGFYNAYCRKVPDEINQLLTELILEHPKGQKLAKDILLDCASYMNEEVKPHFMQSQIKNIHVGFVKLMNISEQYHQNSIHEKDSMIHARQIDGIEHKGLGHISNSGMKMTYTAGNAKKVALIIDEDFQLIKSLTKLIRLTKRFLSTGVQTPYEKNIESLLNITYRNRMLELILSKTSKNISYQKMAELIAREIIHNLQKRQESLSSIQRFFSKNTIDDIPEEASKIKYNN